MSHVTLPKCNIPHCSAAAIMSHGARQYCAKHWRELQPTTNKEAHS